MSKLPGGPLSKRPLHFIWVADCSGSMSLAGKIESLNQAIRQSVDPMQDTAATHPFADVFVRCLKFSNGAAWHIKEPTPLAKFEWVDLVADPIKYVNIETEIIFLLDTSGSMGAEKNFVVSNCLDFAEIIIQKGANVKMGVVGFAIGDVTIEPQSARVVRLAKYNLGIWDLAEPKVFKENVKELKLRRLGSRGCYLAEQQSVEIFDHIAELYSPTSNTKKILVIISDELGGTEGVEAIANKLNDNQILTYVVGLPGELKAHQAIAKKTKGRFWDIKELRHKYAFENLLNEVAESIAQEIVTMRSDGIMGTGTDMGQALYEIAKVLEIPPMEENALPPVIVLISDGKPTDDFNAGFDELISLAWGQKAVKLSIAIGSDASYDVLKKFMYKSPLEPLVANNPEALIDNIRWATTVLVKSVSSPASQAGREQSMGNVPIPRPPRVKIDVSSVW